MKVFTCALLATAFLLIGCSAAQADDAEPIRVLYITGGGFHDYEGQKQILTEGLGARANIEWTIDHEAGGDNAHKLSRYDDPEWYEPFDLVIYNMCFASVSDVDYVETFSRAHHDHGTPALVLHCAMHSYRDAETDDWDHLIGLDTYHHEPAGSFLVEGVADEHPIMAGFPADGWQTPQDEIYIVRESFDQITPLATAYGEHTGEDHTVIWTNQYGKARIFGTTVGHSNPTVAHPVFLDVVARGLLWSVEKLDEQGDPLPGYEGTGEGLVEAEPFAYEAAERVVGESIGTEGAWGNSGNTRDKALDGDTETFFDAPEADGAWVGLDLGERTKIIGVRFAPRQGHAGRMVGGKLQGANEADFSDAVDLYSVGWQDIGGITARPVKSDGSFRYVRYLSPASGHANTALVEFYSE
ncbi:MAG: ThuA domain-containing protein [Phycisphaeraceae bacterium]